MTKSEKIQAELAIIQANQELIDPAVVVDWARENPASVLHGEFEWDNAEAGNQYRLWQARRLIALHVVTVEGERKTVSLTIDRVKEGGYRHIEDVVRVPELRDCMLRDALRELRRIQRKYSQLKELAGIFDELEKLDPPASAAA